MKKSELGSLASKIAKAEGKKSEVAIGDIREILKILKNMQSAWLLSSDGKRSKESPLSIIHTFASRDNDKKK